MERDAMTTGEGSRVRVGDRSAVYRRIGWRLLPLLCVCYVFAAMDRVNVGFAKLHMAGDIGLSEAAYGLGAGIFFVGYVVFEVPSNLLLARIGARRTIVRIMVLWGLTAAAMMFVHGTASFLVLRVLLGVFEAGFAPGVLFYLGYWYPAARRATPMTLFLLAGPISSMLGGPLSAWIMTGLDGARGLAGWQWLFLLEGLPTVGLAVVVWRVLADSPAEARWLSAEERAAVVADVGADQDRRGTHEFSRVLRDPRVYALAFSYFCLIGGMYAMIFWLPTILADNGVDSTMAVGLYSAVPYAAAIVAMILWSRRSDRRGERRMHSAIPAMVSGVAMLVAAFTTGHLAVGLPAIVVATACAWASYAVFWAMPAGYLSGRAAAGGIALINSIGVLGGFVSPTLLGLFKDWFGSDMAGLLFLVALLLVGGVGIATNRLTTDARD